MKMSGLEEESLSWSPDDRNINYHNKLLVYLNIIPLHKKKRPALQDQATQNRKMSIDRTII